MDNLIQTLPQVWSSLDWFEQVFTSPCSCTGLLQSYNAALYKASWRDSERQTFGMIPLNWSTFKSIKPVLSKLPEFAMPFKMQKQYLNLEVHADDAEQLMQWHYWPLLDWEAEWSLKIAVRGGLFNCVVFAMLSLLPLLACAVVSLVVVGFSWWCPRVFENHCNFAHP